MSKGLKELVEAAMGAEAPAPVTVSGEAHAALATKMREWSGWSKARLVLGDPRTQGSASPYAATLHPPVSQFTVNVDVLLLNPHRVLHTVTPFRLKQEAVLTGAMLHEAGHARYSLWQPGRYGNPVPALHGDGAPVADSTLALARLMEEPRVEGLTARDADRIGAYGLGWTLRASAAHLLPPTVLSADPDEQIMGVIESWALRAGRQIGLVKHVPGFEVRNWVNDYNTLLHSALENHVTAQGDAGDPALVANQIKALLLDMISCTDDRGTTMVDKAREVMALLFPETSPESQPEVGGGCAAPMQAEASEEQDSEGDSDEQESEDSGATGSTDTDEDDSDDEADDEADEEPGTGDESDDEGSEGDEDQPEDDSPADGGSEPDEGESGEGEVDTDSPLAEALSEMEAQAGGAMESEADDDAEEAEAEAARGAGAGAGGDADRGWRTPSKAERETAANAEKFLRRLIEPTETSRSFLSDTPSSVIDGAEMAAWKAGGQVRDPRFFRRTQRMSQPSPPVRIAVLADTSASMDVLQKPTALLSWALASAALDLRNFAGRGVQVESCLIHWGDDARVIAKNGEMMPGIKEFSCHWGTSAMNMALEAVEEQMPGFFDITETPVNRLLVQFTDWELSFTRGTNPGPQIARAMEAGVNMLSVVPGSFDSGWNRQFNMLPAVMKHVKVRRGKHEVLRYNPMMPEQVWDKAAEVLSD